MAKTVLIVDDSATVRLAVMEALKPAGFEVLEAADGGQGLKQLSANPVDLILSDVNLPVFDGIELLRQIKHSPATKSIPVIMLTTVSEKERIIEAAQLGILGWVVKPFTAETLVARVKKALE